MLESEEKNMKKLLKAGLSLALVATAALTTTSITAQASETNTNIENINLVGANEALTYNGHEVISNSYKKDGSTIEYKYSDGYFEVDPRIYQPHMATTSTILTHASDTIVKDGDYSHGADRLVEVLTNMGYEDIYVSDSYKVKPTPTSIACVIASRRVEIMNQYRRIVTIVVRSSSYEQEWASNVVLGKEGEADGFESAANKIVGEYLEQYLRKTSNLLLDICRGKVDFWVTGYSRGGATANLTSKKLIDKYGSFGRVYGYCIEAPQGGVKEAEYANKDYTSIHNVINVNDAVCYVAPSAFGFKRYGVDHYLIGTDADSMNLNQYTNRAFGETGVDYDNIYYSEDSEEYQAQYELMMKHLRALNSNATPYRYTNYAYDYQNFEVVAEGQTDTYEAIRSFFTNFIANNPNHKTTRDQYVDQGIEKAARRLCQFIFSGADISKIKDTALANASFGKIAKTVIDFIISNPSILISGNSDSIFDYIIGYGKTIYDLFFDRTGLRFRLDFDDDEIDELADDLVELLLGTDDTSEAIYDSTHDIPVIGTIFDWFVEDDAKEAKKMKTLFEKYEGGLEGAREDLKALTKLLLGKLQYTSDINLVLTFAYNAGDLFAKNHATLLTLAWLRSYDTWYEPTLN